jgi:anaerobic magnesium-protoporphyrin IX monomethyl ester cyclase|tara:strand:- start:615 stop:2156 length:1542 start_codon:yes stop_codon:yes gene_type:complete
MAKILLINPSYQAAYGNSKASIVNPFFPTLGLATIAAVARKEGHHVEILDLCWRPYDYNLIKERVVQGKPDIVGITATTAGMNQLRDISCLVKNISEKILVVGGGAHLSALPMESLCESRMDVVCVGEGDYSFTEICDGKPLSEINGVYYRYDDEIFNTPLRQPVANLDDLPMPAWDLYDPADYKKISKLIASYPPVATVEFSRGCVFTCDFCASKVTMALGYRKKSPERCAEEVKYLSSLGFNEFWLADDIFTSDQKWAGEVSEKIIEKNVDMHWTCNNGIRVESADDELFNKMKKAGCYKVSFGFESGNDEVLKGFGKGGKATTHQGKVAVKKASEAGLQTNAYFMLGLSCDDEESMLDTVEYARTLPVDLLKFGLAIAFPGTEMFDNYVRKKLVKSYDWDKYVVYTDEHLFVHEKIEYEKIQSFVKYAYKRAVTLNPQFAFRRFYNAIKNGDFLSDLYHGFLFVVMPSVSTKNTSIYAAQNQWPVYDFVNNSPRKSIYQSVSNATVDSNF